jgi:Domain of unknown function (DUF4190)
VSYPAPPPYATYAPPPAPAPPATKGAGLAIASMVLGIIALLLCWIPIINNVAAVIALVGLGLGIPAFIRARRGTHGGKGMAIAGLVTSLVGLVLVFATQALFVAAIDEAVEEVDRVSSADAPPVESEGAEQAATDADPVPLGTPATVGDYQVTVDAVELNGNVTVAGANEFNEKPAGQYVVVTVTATYEGATEGTPAFDLTAVYNGTDSRQYSDSECFATLPQDAMDAPTLNPGGTATFQFCMDVPPAAIDGGVLFMEPTMSFEEERTFFAVQ